ncbi:MAG: hypothetical protein ED859_03505 [Desulfuromonadales bacterium]|nr:MAG: hypothetical protein ED859_03505 [Desulfuromonadales bacterium]
MACSTEQHKMHMCALNAEGNEELIRSITANATVECENCGAVANDPKYVCSPRQLPDIAWMGDGADQCKKC